MDPNSQQHKKSRIALFFNQQRRKLRANTKNILLICFKAENRLHSSTSLGAGLDPFQRSLHLFLSICSWFAGDLGIEEQTTSSSHSVTEPRNVSHEFFKERSSPDPCYRKPMHELVYSLRVYILKKRIYIYIDRYRDIYIYVCACVDHLNRCKRFYLCRGMAAVSLAVPMKLWDSAGRVCGCTLLCPQIWYSSTPVRM